MYLYTVVTGTRSRVMAFNLVFSPSVVTDYVVSLPSFLSDVLALATKFKDDLSVFSVDRVSDGTIRIRVINKWASTMISSCAKHGKLRYIVLDNTLGDHDNSIEPFVSTPTPEDTRLRIMYEFKDGPVKAEPLVTPADAGCEVMK